MVGCRPREVRCIGTAFPFSAWSLKYSRSRRRTSAGPSTTLRHTFEHLAGAYFLHPRRLIRRQLGEALRRLAVALLSLPRMEGRSPCDAFAFVSHGDCVGRLRPSPD